MKRYLMLPMLLALAGGSAIAGTATDEIRLGQPNYGGTGCPAGTASTTLSPDAQSLSILFDAYQAEAGGVIGRNTDRKACNIAIPVTVPQGYSVSIIQIDYRGFNTLPSGAQSRFSVEYFFAGSQGPAFAQNFFGPITQDFLINNTLRAEAVVWSACGADVNLRANTSLFVQSNSYNEQAMASVDSADVQASVVFQLQWKRCGNGGGGGYPAPAPVPTYPPTPAPLPPPAPIPPAPIPQPGYSDCSIESVTDYYGGVIYRVLDWSRRILGEYNTYRDAERAVQIFDSRGMCRSQGGGGGYPQPMPPRPTPVPPGHGKRDKFSCTISTPYGSFMGTGRTKESASAEARTSCIHSGQTSFTCNRAPVSCFKNR